MATVRGNVKVLKFFRRSSLLQMWKFGLFDSKPSIVCRNGVTNDTAHRFMRTSAVCHVNKKHDRKDDDELSTDATPPLMVQMLSNRLKQMSHKRDKSQNKIRDKRSDQSCTLTVQTDLHKPDDLSSRAAEWKKELDEIERDAQIVMKKKKEAHSYVAVDTDIDSSVDVSSSDGVEDFVEYLTLDDDGSRVAKVRPKKKLSIYGTPNPEIPKSDIPCAGCGALLHCQEETEHGYMPSEKFTSLTTTELRKELCQRCFLIKHHKIYLNVGVTTKEYPAIIEKIKNTNSLVMVVVDLTDIQNSIYSELLEHIGTNRPLYIIGNKADLIPGDHRGYLKHLREALVSACERAGLNPTGQNLQHACVVSARTGYGVEDLITKLMSHWGNKGDVYLVGSTNAGKSTLFNALLASDYCKSNLRNIIHRATASNWPGTTLNLLKFPIVTPTPWRLKQRQKRLSAQKEEEKREKMLVRLEKDVRKPTPSLLAHIGTTDFRSEESRTRGEKEEEDRRTGAGQELVSFQLEEDDDIREAPGSLDLPSEEDLLRERYHLMYQHSKWHYDTPGIIREEQVINQLTKEELAVLMPKGQLKPRVHVVKPGHSLLVSALGRLDYLEGQKSAFFTVVSSKSVPVFVMPLEEVEEFYREHAGTKRLGVPLGDADRLKQLPPLKPTEFTLTCKGLDEATADIQLSSLGWVAVAGDYNMRIRLQGYTVGGLGCYMRQPPLLPFYKKFRGRRIGKGSEYQPVMPAL